MNLFERLVRTITWRLAQVGQAALVLVMCIIVLNVFLRGFWRPVPGTVELTELLGGILLATGVAYTAAMKGHIMVGYFVEQLSPRLQAIVDIITHAIALIFTILLTNQSFIFAARMLERNYRTADLLIPIYPAVYLVALSFIMLALVLIKDLIKAAIIAVRGSEAA